MIVDCMYLVTYATCVIFVQLQYNNDNLTEKIENLRHPQNFHTEKMLAVITHI